MSEQPAIDVLDEIVSSGKLNSKVDAITRLAVEVATTQYTENRESVVDRLLEIVNVIQVAENRDLEVATWSLLRTATSMLRAKDLWTRLRPYLQPGLVPDCRAVALQGIVHVLMNDPKGIHREHWGSLSDCVVDIAKQLLQPHVALTGAEVGVLAVNAVGAAAALRYDDLTGLLLAVVRLRKSWLTRAVSLNLKELIEAWRLPAPRLSEDLRVASQIVSTDRSASHPRALNIRAEDVDSEKHWVTKDGDVLLIRDMDDSHLVNCIRMLRRKGFRSASEIESVFSFGPPQGEMALDAWMNMLDDAADAPIAPALDALEKEAKRRKLKID